MVWGLESITYNLLSLESPDVKELTGIHLLAALGCLADATSI
jgi:hypothetical protein